MGKYAYVITHQDAEGRDCKIIAVRTSWKKAKDKVAYWTHQQGWIFESAVHEDPERKLMTIRLSKVEPINADAKTWTYSQITITRMDYL